MAGYTVSQLLFLLCHGQTRHNPRAEAAEGRGCSTEEFLNLMQKNGAFDASLTKLAMSTRRHLPRW